MSRLKFPLTPSESVGSAASVADLEALTELGFIAKFRVDVFRTFVGNKNFFRMTNKKGMAFSCYSDGSTAELGCFDTDVFGQQIIAPFLVSLLPANGNDVVLYAYREAAGTTMALGLPDGTVIVAGTGIGVAFNTGAGTGLLEILSTSSVLEYGMEYDFFGIITAPRTGDDRFAKPVASDTDTIRRWYMAEGSGGTTVDADAAAVMTLTNTSWLTGGEWDAGEAAVFDAIVITDNPNETYEDGVLLLPITVQKQDQFGNPTTLGPATVTAESLELGVTLIGTLEESFSGSDAIFDNLTPDGEGEEPPPEPEPPVVSLTRRIEFTSAALAAQVSGVVIGTAITAKVVTLLGATDTDYVTPVQLVVKRGAGRTAGSTIVTPVAGIITFPMNTVGVRLDDNVSAASIQLGIASMFGVNQPFDVAVPGLAASLNLGQSRIPAGAARAVVQITGAVAGGNIRLEATADDVNWGVIDATPYAAGAAANTFTAAFFGSANVTGLRQVRLMKSVLGVTYGTATLTVSEE